MPRRRARKFRVAGEPQNEIATSETAATETSGIDKASHEAAEQAGDVYTWTQKGIEAVPETLLEMWGTEWGRPSAGDTLREDQKSLLEDAGLDYEQWVDSGLFAHEARSLHPVTRVESEGDDYISDNQDDSKVHGMPLGREVDEEDEEFGSCEAKNPDACGCASDSGETMATDEDELLCLFCYEPLGDENPVADVTTWSVSQHALASPSCGVFSRSCCQCLLHFVNKHEQDPDKDGGYPCPLCRVPLREPTRENVGRRTCTKAIRASAPFRSDCLSFLESLSAENAPHNQPASRNKRVELGQRDKAIKTSLEELVESHPDAKDAPWYTEAHALHAEDHRVYRRVRSRYQELWPARTGDGGGRPAAFARTQLWEAYDPVLWENATASVG